MGLASPCPKPAGEHQGLAGVEGSLVDPAGREVGHPGTQENERGPGVSLVTAERLDRARDQWERLVNPAGDGVFGAEDRGGERYPGDELPRAAEVEKQTDFAAVTLTFFHAMSRR